MQIAFVKFNLLSVALFYYSPSPSLDKEMYVSVCSVAMKEDESISFSFHLIYGEKPNTYSTRAHAIISLVKDSSLCIYYH